MTEPKYKPLRHLGQGAYGSVFLTLILRGEDEGQVKATKCQDTTIPAVKRAVEKEIVLLEKFKGVPFITQIYDNFLTGTRRWIVMDYYAGGDMINLLDEATLRPEEARFYIAEVAVGLNEIHKRRILHRDIKPENTLIHASGHVAIADFGLSVRFPLGTEEVCRTPGGTVEYKAPEAFTPALGYSYASDWWSFGCLAYGVLTSGMAFTLSDGEGIVERIKGNDPPFAPRFHPSAKDFVLQLLRKKPEERLGSKAGLEEIKDHPFMKGVEWDDVVGLRTVPPFLFDPESEGFQRNPNFDNMPLAPRSISKRKLAWEEVISPKKTRPNEPLLAATAVQSLGIGGEGESQPKFPLFSCKDEHRNASRSASLSAEKRPTLKEILESGDYNLWKEFSPLECSSTKNYGSRASRAAYLHNSCCPPEFKVFTAEDFTAWPHQMTLEEILDSGDYNLWKEFSPLECYSTNKTSRRSLRAADMLNFVCPVEYRVEEYERRIYPIYEIQDACPEGQSTASSALQNSGNMAEPLAEGQLAWPMFNEAGAAMEMQGLQADMERRAELMAEGQFNELRVPRRAAQEFHGHEDVGQLEIQGFYDWIFLGAAQDFSALS